MPAANVGTAYVQVRPDLTAFGREMRTGLSREIKTVGDDSARTLSASFSDAAKKSATAFGVGFAAIKLKDFLGGAIQAASDLAESTSKVGVVFDDSAAKVRAFAETAATSIGQSNQQALEATGTFGNLFVALGITGDRAADMSIQMVQLASDLASFNNVSPDEALLALRSGLVGETEPLRRFGVNMNDATLRTKALQLGLKATGATLDPMVKAQAAYALILEQTGTAQGDFARTAGGLANQQRIATAEWADAKAELGEGLLPVMVNLAKVLNEQVIPAFRILFDPSNPANDPHSWAATISDAVGDLFGFFADIEEQALRNLANFIDVLPGNIGEGFVAGLRQTADSVGEFSDKLHASVAEMQDWAGATRNADAAAKLMAGSSREAADAVDALGKVTAGSSKEARDAAKAQRDLQSAQRTLDQLLKQGAVDEEKVAAAREHLDDATRSLGHANRELAKAQEDYNDAQAAFLALPTDTNADKLRDATDGLADAQDGVADAAARQKDAQADLTKAQAGDPDFQDKLADAKDGVADAQDKVNKQEGIAVGNTGQVVAGINARTDAMMALNREFKIAGDSVGVLDDIGNILGTTTGKAIPPPPPTIGFAPAAGTFGFSLPTVHVPMTAPAPAATTNNVTVNVTQPVPDPGLIGKAVAWALP